MFLDKHDGAITALATVAIVALTFFYVRYSKRQWQVMERQLDLSERPWISSEFMPGLLYFKEDGAFLNMDIKLTNVGHSVAQSITAWTKLHFDTVTLLSEAERYCGTPKQPINKNVRNGYMLFPGQSLTFPQPAAALPQDIEKALKTGDFKEMKMITIYVITCIDYRSPLDSQHHQTRRHFSLGRPDTQRHTVSGIFEPHGEYTDFVVIAQAYDSAD